METNHKIQFESVHSFNLTNQELRNMYLYLALFEFRELRNPNYNQVNLLVALTSEFKKLLAGVLDLINEQPNNYAAHRLASFFDRHYKKLLELQK